MHQVILKQTLEVSLSVDWSVVVLGWVPRPGLHCYPGHRRASQRDRTTFMALRVDHKSRLTHCGWENADGVLGLGTARDVAWDSLCALGSVAGGAGPAMSSACVPMSLLWTVDLC